MPTTWTKEENSLMRGCVEAQMDLGDIRELFPTRSETSIHRHYHRFRSLYAPPAPDEVKERATAQMKRDQKFQDALMAAINAGLEKCPVGIVVTPVTEEWRRRVMRTTPTRSLYGSPAALCAESFGASSLGRF